MQIYFIILNVTSKRNKDFFKKSAENASNVSLTPTDGKLNFITHKKLDKYFPHAN